MYYNSFIFLRLPFLIFLWCGRNHGRPTKSCISLRTSGSTAQIEELAGPRQCRNSSGQVCHKYPISLLKQHLWLCKQVSQSVSCFVAMPSPFAITLTSLRDLDWMFTECIVYSSFQILVFWHVACFVVCSFQNCWLVTLSLDSNSNILTAKQFLHAIPWDNYLMKVSLLQAS